MDFPDEINLINRLQNGDPDAFEKLFHRYKAQVYAFALRLMPSARDAEEIVQEVFMAIWNQRKSLQVTASFHSYLFGIARHKVYEIVQQKLRYEAFTEYYLERNPAYAFVTEEDVYYNQLVERLEELLKEIPDRRREIFLLSRNEGLSYAEIAEKLDITENTVDTQIRHALNHLRSRFSE